MLERFSRILASLVSGSRTPAAAFAAMSDQLPKQIQCFSPKPGVLVGLVQRGAKDAFPVHPYYDADTTQGNPAAPTCPQLILAGDPSTTVNLEVIPRPTSRELEHSELEGFEQLVMQHHPRRPELKAVCICLVNKTERKHKAAQQANAKARRHRGPARIRVQVAPKERKPAAHSPSAATLVAMR